MNDETARCSPYAPEFEYGKRNLWLKFALDRTLAATALLLLIPLFAVIALSVLAQSVFRPAARGPILISERRMSRGAPFTMFKFCTYYVREDELHAHKRGTTDFVNDRNVTPVGWILRKFYLDELPQIWNILMGHMSFVGPRPVPEPMYLDVLRQGYQCKRVLRAGLGGPVQALKGKWREYGRYLEADEDLIDEYLGRSAGGVVALDLAIMWRTFRKAQEGDGLELPGR